MIIDIINASLDVWSGPFGEFGAWVLLTVMFTLAGVLIWAP